jgi:hypothetical protein
MEDKYPLYSETHSYKEKITNATLLSISGALHFLATDLTSQIRYKPTSPKASAHSAHRAATSAERAGSAAQLGKQQFKQHQYCPARMLCL